MFQLRVIKSQVSYKLQANFPDDDSSTEESLVMHTIDIVKSFIDRHPCSVVEDEDEQRLVIERIGGNAQTVMEMESCRSSISVTEKMKESTGKKPPEPETLTMKEELFEEVAEDYNALDEDSLTTEDEEEEETEHITPEDLENEPEYVIEQDSNPEKSTTDRFVFDNVEFVERTPEYLINAYKPSEKPSRPKDPDNWIRNKQRNARAKGKEYVTVSGKVIAAKRMQSPCKETCRYKCRTKISEEHRQRNFDNYWQLASFILQRKFIYEHHKTSPIQRRRFRTEGGKPREYSSHYFLDKFNSNGNVEQVQVCEKMFLKTFDICRNIVAYLHKKVQTGTVQDLRGINRRKLSAGHEAAILQIKANQYYHIENPMPIAKLFEHYQQECVEKEVEPVKSHTYRKLFNEYNFEFLKRDKVLCDICDSYNKASDEEKSFLADKHIAHVKGNEKCMQRAKAKDRAALKVVRRKTLKQQKMQAEQDAKDDEMIVEEHLNDELEYS